MTRSERPQRGFAYLWVLLTVALMGLGLAVAGQVHGVSVQREKEQELLSIGRQFRAAIFRYREVQGLGSREYPASLDDLLFDRRVPGGRRHLRQVFVDPMTGKAEWGLVRVAGRIVGVHSLSERTPIKQGRFEAEDAGFAGKQKYSEWAFTYPSDLMQRGGVPGAGLLPAGNAASAPGPFGPASGAGGGGGLLSNPVFSSSPSKEPPR